MVEHSLKKIIGRNLGITLALGAGVMTSTAFAFDQVVASFPKEIIPADAGSIELYAKLIGYAASDPITTGVSGGGSYPALLRLFDQTDNRGFLLSFTANNGLGGGGLAASFGGTPGGSIADTAATGSSTNSFTYGDILGSCVDCWHKYEVRWNKDGLPGVDNGYRKLAVYLDGVLASNYFLTDADATFPVFEGGQLDLGYPHSQGILDKGFVAFDEFKIFDGQGNLVLYNSLDSVNAIENSTVGLNGTYVMGDFVPGASGSAIMQVVPEPETYALMLVGLGLVGWLARRQGQL